MTPDENTEQTQPLEAPYVLQVTEATQNPEIERRFSYHAPKGDQAARYERIRHFAKAFAYLIDQTCPKSREQSLAFTHLEDAVYCANASIARNE